jgi:uncharacterized protein
MDVPALVHEDRKMEDRKIAGTPILLSSISLSSLPTFRMAKPEAKRQPRIPLKRRPVPAKRQAMKAIRIGGAALALTILSFTFLAPAGEPAQPLKHKIRVLLITGGHPFQKEAFFKLFQDNPDITYQAVVHPQAYAMLTAKAAKQYDVIVTYDYNQKIPEEARRDFVARLKEGKGLVVLHHAIAAYPGWPEYWKIIGAHYYLAKTNINGVAKPRSAAKEGMDFRVHIADPNHPVTRGLKDYDMHGETYKWFDLAKNCHPLLTTDTPESNKVIAWAKTYKGTRVVYIESGHGPSAYDNPNYQQLLRQAIRWVARQD